MNNANKINTYLCHVPSALAGLALAIGSLGFCWENVADLHGIGLILGAVVASLMLLPIFLKYLFNLHLLKEDLQHPIAGSVLPTLAMATMVFANNISEYSLPIAQVISWLAIILHLLFFGYFVFYRSRHFIFKQILPSWFIPPIGLALPIITHPGGLPSAFADSFLFLGLISYAVLLPVVVYRLLFSEQLTDNEKPIVVILATPASLLLLSYLVGTQLSYGLIVVLLVLAILMTFYAYFALIKLLKLPFTPAYSVFTFPLVVGAIALFKMNQFLLKEGFSMLWVDITLQLAQIELMIASAIVLYVTACYVLKYRPTIKS